MKKYFHHIIILLAFIFCQLITKAQSNALSSIQNAYEIYNSNHLPEKLFIHTDKSVYLNNEICWFKVYALEGFFHTPLSLNKVAYVELLNANHQAVIQEKIGLNNASGNGSLQIPANIPSGNYTLVAYTNWMKNFNPAFYFTKPITILNTQNELEHGYLKQKDTYQLNVYPESGNLLSDISNTIAFSIVNQYGNGVQSKGWVLNNKADTICQLKTLLNGLGSFMLTPKEDETYKAILETPNGILEKPLPKALNKGYTIHASQINNNILQISVNNKYFINKTAYLIIHCRGIVKKALELNIANNINTLDIPIEVLGEGINTITLFDDLKNPVAERLYFKYPKQIANQVNIESSIYKNRSKVNFSIESIANSVYDASISVYKIDGLQSKDEMNIENYLWLSADLAGKIDSPQSYFDTLNATRFVAMDLLMLTNGWRRFSAENLNDPTNTNFNYLPEIGGSLITGKIVNKGTRLPSNETAGYLSVPSKNTVFKSALSDQNGKVIFQFQEFNNNGQIIAQADSVKNVINKIEIDNPFVGKNIKWNTVAQSDKIFTQKNELSNWHRNVQVQNYYNTSYNNQFSENAQDTNAFYFTPSRTYYLDDYARFTTLEEVIREYVTPVTLVKEKGKYQFYVYDDAYKQFFEQSPLVLLDGVIIKDIDKFLEYDPLKIRKLEVVSKVYYSGNLAYNGIINFTTYTGKLEGFEMDPNAVILDYKGLQAKRIFNAPTYQTEAQIQNRLPDFRQMLYWNPNAQLGKSNHFSFYNSDIKGDFLISIQGINKEGAIINQSIPFTVK